MIKKLLTLFFTLGICLTSYAEELSTYSNEAEKIKFQYPSNWAIKENQMGSLVAFVSPRESESDSFMENVNLLLENTPPDTSLEKYNSYGLEMLKKVVTDFNIIESNDTTLGGLPASNMIYTGRMGEFNLKYFQVWTLKDGKAYVCTYTADQKSFDKYLPVAKNVIDSLKFSSAS